VGEPAENVVQELLAQRRELMVGNERLRLEVEEARRLQGKQDPRLSRLEAENRRLRDELEAARAERDALRSGLDELADRLHRELG
jgi:predicted RNase H-like nuclease (RuvC/YqgF family)